MDTGLKAIHPITNEQLPVWVANFVLMAYGTGAVMAVPGHDQRDQEFANKYGLPIRQVIALKEPKTKTNPHGNQMSGVTGTPIKPANLNSSTQPNLTD